MATYDVFYSGRVSLGWLQVFHHASRWVVEKKAELFSFWERHGRDFDGIWMGFRAGGGSEGLRKPR